MRFVSLYDIVDETIKNQLYTLRESGRILAMAIVNLSRRITHNVDLYNRYLRSYNIVTVEGAAASRVFFHLKAEAVRMGE